MKTRMLGCNRTSKVAIGKIARIKGFTLLELLVVLLIIALLAGYVGPKLFSQVDQAKITTAKAQMKSLSDALYRYRIDTGAYPASELGLNALMEKPPSAAMWHGPYMTKEIPLDPWGHPYQYVIPGKKGEVDIMSFGRDGRIGGENEDADIIESL